jgi:hypothetical protein
MGILKCRLNIKDSRIENHKIRFYSGAAGGLFKLRALSFIMRDGLKMLGMHHIANMKIKRLRLLV